MDLKYTVIDNKYFNIKDILRGEFGISSRLYLKLKNANKIYLNGRIDLFSSNLSIGDIIEVDLGFEEDNSNIVPTKMELDIIYEDKYILAVNKPSGIAVHPSLRHYENSLSNGVKYYFDTINLHRKIRIVNRLDKDTSGIVIFAKNEYIQENLIRQMRDGFFKKEYLGIVNRNFRRKFWNN